MAVYTQVTQADLQGFLAQYALGELHTFKGILAGTENSNYLLELASGRYILTLFEARTVPAELPFFMDLMGHCASLGVLCPKPVAQNTGIVVGQLCGRPAVLVSFLSGQSLARWQPVECLALGRALAGFHLASESFAQQRPNALDQMAWRPLAEKVSPRADELKQGLWTQLDDSLTRLLQTWPQHLPKGIIHADLFPDNVFFAEGAVSGLIDFYFACTDLYAYDLAICLNAWCFEDDVTFNVTKARALLQGYQGVRSLTSAELAAMPTLCQGAAMRFLLTRLYDWFYGPTGELVKKRDPLAYWKRLSFHNQVKSVGEYGL